MLSATCSRAPPGRLSWASPIKIAHHSFHTCILLSTCSEHLSLEIDLSIAKLTLFSVESQWTAALAQQHWTTFRHVLLDRTGLPNQRRTILASHDMTLLGNLRSSPCQPRRRACEEKMNVGYNHCDSCNEPSVAVVVQVRGRNQNVLSCDSEVKKLTASNLQNERRTKSCLEAGRTKLACVKPFSSSAFLFWLLQIQKTRGSLIGPAQCSQSYFRFLGEAVWVKFQYHCVVSGLGDFPVSCTET